MVFSSALFIFGFFPILLLLYFSVPSVRMKNMVLLAASLAFYTWGEGQYIFLLLVLCTANFVFGFAIDRLTSPARRLQILFLAVFVNLGCLLYYKYTGFFVEILNRGLKSLHVPTLAITSVHLPVGISFFTFHSLSYLIDVYRKRVLAQKHFGDLVLYIMLFPQLIAGPIVRYGTVANQLTRRTVNSENFVRGAERFVFGLAKKVLIADCLGRVADQLFSLSQDQVTPAMAWSGAVTYTLQIYYDFSGYSDMAIGLGLIFGFHFEENFTHPYISQTISEFWRRWHISLSTWFRDYVYFPLGGNQKSKVRTGINLLTIFVLCGLWHGAKFTFLIWGLYQGLFLVLERVGVARILERVPRAIRHLYTLLVVTVGFVIFRSENIDQAIQWIRTMFGENLVTTQNSILKEQLSYEVLFFFAVAIVGCTPLFAAVQGRIQGLITEGRSALLRQSAAAFSIVSLFLITLAYVASTRFNPFIYFRF